MLNINDITQTIKNQIKYSDKIYGQAIEQNYSHEQMTPLNSIISISFLAKLNIIKHFCEDQDYELVLNSKANEKQLLTKLPIEA
jgi:hypothetical protein